MTNYFDVPDRIIHNNTLIDIPNKMYHDNSPIDIPESPPSNYHSELLAKYEPYIYIKYILDMIRYLLKKWISTMKLTKSKIMILLYRLISYGENGFNTVPIMKSDMRRLRPDQFLNDNIIQFHLKYTIIFYHKLYFGEL